MAVAAGFQLPAATETFNQPPIFQDLPDIDLIRVDDTYYYSPGATILRSYDLVNWEYLSHYLPSFDFNDPKFNLTKGGAYNGGVYASSLRYHKTQKNFYWLGLSRKTERPTFTQRQRLKGRGRKHHLELLLLKKKESVFKSNQELGYIEGSRFYKINGTYFLWLTNPGVGRGQIIVKSSGDVWGPYDSWHRILKNNGKPIEGSGSPHQGAFVETPEGDYWYMAFVELGTSGRFPVLAPLKWDEKGWPNVKLDSNGNWKSSYNYPLPRHNIKPVEGTFEFKEPKLPPRFEWNHDPNNDKWTTGPDGLVLYTATITDDLFSAQNTLTHRILGPQSNVTIELDYSSMVDGDRAGLVSLRYDAGWIGIVKDGSSTTLQMVDNAAMDPDNSFVTTSKGNVIASKSISGGKIWLRCQISTVSPNRSTFLYSTDGKTFVKLGQEHVTKQGGVWFTGTRHGIFNFATKKSGGHVVVKKFDIRLS
ncbi:hypothetical protein H9Q73_013059 [Fusarium xylarioides]|nr:hypothetical protein H9Q73_013059 [Fusarium xylarioides]